MSATLRTEVLSLWSITQMGICAQKGSWCGAAIGRRTLDEVVSLIAYGCEYPSRKKRTPMNVAGMVRTWVEVIVGLSTSHSKEDLDRCEFEMEKHLVPLIAAPVKELRAFFADLVDALAKDPRVPFFVHRMFEAYHETIVKKAPDGDVVTLKKRLAAEIAELVESAVQPDLKDALVGALQWRSEENLTKVRDAVKSGQKPRLRGRESCLFLCVPDGKGGEEQVML